jgi:hypothetical protein
MGCGVAKRLVRLPASAADPDPVPFLPLEPGSGIRDG